MRISWRQWYIASAITGLALARTPVALSQRAVRPSDDRSRVAIAAGARYEAGTLHRWFGGNTYRDLWVTPIRVPLLDIRTFAGGIRPIKEGGGLQTKSLRFKSADGTEYVFRLSDKTASGAPGILKNTPLNRLFQDAVSAMHPAAAEIAAPIIQATGVLHVTPVLMVMADDDELGKYRKDFGGKLGMIEEYPTVPAHAPGFAGASMIIDSPELLALLDADPTQHVNARAFLMARLTDFLINDNDRHPGNWKWARINTTDTSTQWEPIARDRDHAFVSYDGVLMRFVGLGSPTLGLFGEAPNVPRLTKSRGFDARLLSELDKRVWDSVMVSLQARVTNAVIESAGRAMPMEYHATAPHLEALLRLRRAALPAAANQFYKTLAARVEVHGTDVADRASITRVDDRYVDVRLSSAGVTSYSRRFDARETSEILVYLHDGADTAFITGHAAHSILVRVIGGNGRNTLIDSSNVGGDRHPARLYDGGTVSGISYGEDTLFDRRPWENEHGKMVPPNPDVGARYEPVAGLSFRRGIGLAPKVGVVRYGNALGERPYSSMLRLEGEYGIAFHGVRLGLAFDKRREYSPWHVTAAVRMSDFELINYSGLGNATIDSSDIKGYFNVRERQWLFHPAVAFTIGSRTELALGPVIKHTAIDSAESPFVSATQPYGYGTTTQAGMQLSARYEWYGMRNRGDEHTHHRLVVEVGGTYFPAALDVRSAFTTTAATVGAAITLPVPLHPFLVARAGGKKLFGAFPFYEAATIGGEGTTRYMDTERYAGDASVFASTELRIPVAHFRLVVPLRMGVMGLAEGGRVFDRGSSPGGWHTRTGEGIWLGRGDASSVVTFARTTEPGHPGIHVRLGLNF